MTKYRTGGRRRPHEIALLVVAVAAAGFNLRTAVTSVPPLFPDMQTTLHLSSATLSLLAATPVICFGVVSAFAAWLNRRYGEEMNLLVALILLTAGLLLRGLLPGAMLFPGTVLAAGAIAASLLSVPLYRSSGGSVRLALGVWAAPAAVAVLLWLPQLGYRH